MIRELVTLVRPHTGASTPGIMISPADKAKLDDELYNFYALSEWKSHTHFMGFKLFEGPVDKPQLVWKHLS